VVRIIRLLTDRARRLAVVFATVILKYCFIQLMPLKKKHILRIMSGIRQAVVT